MGLTYDSDGDARAALRKGQGVNVHKRLVGGGASKGSKRHGGGPKSGSKRSRGEGASKEPRGGGNGGEGSFLDSLNSY